MLVLSEEKRHIKGLKRSRWEQEEKLKESVLVPFEESGFLFLPVICEHIVEDPQEREIYCRMM